MANLYANTPIKVTTKLRYNPAEIDMGDAVGFSMRLKKPDDSIITLSLSVVQLGPPLAIVEVTTTASQTALSGQYDYQVVVDFGSFTLPADPAHFTLKARL